MKHNFPRSLPVNDLLNLGIKDVQLAEGIDGIHLDSNDLEELHTVLHCGIRESVYQGTHLMDMFRQKVKGGTEQAPVFMLYRHVLDIGDSIGTLLRFGSTSSASILLRTLFESNLALHFLLEGNALHNDRSLAFWACYQIKKLETFTKYDPSTDAGKVFHQILANDAIAGKTNFQKQDHSRERGEIERILHQNKFRNYYAQYKALKKARKPRHWYSLCSNVTDLRALAKSIGREAEYILLYSRLSELAHSTDIITERLAIADNGHTLIHPLRGPNESLKWVSLYAYNYLLKSHFSIVASYFSADDEVRKRFLKWYEKYRNFYLWLSGRSP